MSTFESSCKDVPPRLEVVKQVPVNLIVEAVETSQDIILARLYLMSLKVFEKLDGAVHLPLESALQEEELSELLRRLCLPCFHGHVYII